MSLATTVVEAVTGTEPVALLPAYTQTYHHRTPDGRTFPEYLDDEIKVLQASIAQLEAQMAGVKATLERKHREALELKTARRVYDEVTYDLPAPPLHQPVGGRPQVRPLPAQSSPQMLARQHGTNSTYTAGCRCERCRKAHRDYARSLRHRNR